MMMRNEELERKNQELRKHRRKANHGGGGDGSNDNSFSSRPGNEFGSYDE